MQRVMKTYSKVVERKKDGSFERWIGEHSPGKRTVFRLSADISQDEAERRIRLIEALWKAVLASTKRPDSPHQSFDDAWGPPTWDEARLELARQIQKGKVPKLGREPLETAAEYVRRLAKASDVIGVRVEAEDEAAAQAGLESLRASVEQTNNRIARVVGAEGVKLTGQLLHKALETYKTSIEKEYVGSDDGLITDNGSTKRRQVKALMAYLPDVDLGSLDYNGCDSLFAVFRNRPISKRYEKPMSHKSCTNYIGELGRFFSWLHRSPHWQFRLPEDFSQIKKTPRDIDDDAERMSQPVPTWKIDELVTLWQYCNPLDRIFFLLGLNCAYGADQSGRLMVSHLKFSVRPGRSRIARVRRKKKTLAIHRMWQATEQALRWALERRPKDAPSDHLLLTAEGTPYWRKTKGGNRAQDIPNLWTAVLDRVTKDFPNFRRLPFNSLRDTSSDRIRRIAGGEIASVHLAHKHQTDDYLLGAYTNPLRKRHAKALAKLEAKYARIFLSVENPFPTEQPKITKDGGPNISVGQSRRIQQLENQGYKRKKIAEMVGVSVVTVWRHLGAKKKLK
jgi:hypothetical protein